MVRHSSGPPTFATRALYPRSEWPPWWQYKLDPAGSQRRIRRAYLKSCQAIVSVSDTDDDVAVVHDPVVSDTDDEVAVVHDPLDSMSQEEKEGRWANIIRVTEQSGMPRSW